MKPQLSLKVVTRFVAAFAAVIAATATSSNAQPIASDNAGNYGGGWTSGSNGGTGFGAWTIDSGNGGNGTGFGGTIIGNSTAAGITGMTNPSFGLYANPTGSGAFSAVKRAFSAPLAVGETFSFEWGINFDSGAGGNKGFHIFTGGISGTSFANVNNGGSPAITLGGTDIGFGYGTNVMTWTFNYSSATTVVVTANDRDGVGTYTNTLTVTGAPDAFEFYASDLQDGDREKREPYFNNLSIVPEPSTWALIILGSAFILWRVRTRRLS